MITTLNVIYAGQAKAFELDVGVVRDDEIIRIAEEAWPLEHGTLANFMVDRLRGLGGEDAIYVRPKVPFGGEAAADKTDPAIPAVPEVKSAADILAHYASRDRGLLARMAANITTGLINNPHFDDPSVHEVTDAALKLALGILVRIDGRTSIPFGE